MDSNVTIQGVAKTPIRIISIFFSIVKLISYAVLEFPYLHLTYYRIVVSVIMITLVYALTASKGLTQRQLSIVLPMSVTILELSFVLFIGGDRLTYVFLMGVPLLSLLYMDIRGIIIVMLSNLVMVAFILFGLNMQLMGSYSFDWIDDYISLVGVGVMYVVYYMLSRYSINAILAARKDAEDAIRSKTEFFVKVSHEIRTPISAVLGISEIGLQIPDLPPKATHSFDKIYASGKLLLGIINDILDFSKITSGKMSLSEERYEISDLINTAANLRYTYLSGKDITFRLSIDENLPKTLVGDALRIEQIIINILSNAFKYTDNGFIELILTCAPLSAAQTEVVVIIKDTGIGMNQEQIKHIFNDYVRFHEQKSNITGTGLGMSVVSHLVQLMDAKITIESEPDEGTTVTIRVPQKVTGSETIGKETAEKMQSLEPYVSQEEIQNNLTPSLMPYGKVLVVDDIDINLYVAQGLLAFYDLNVEICASGFEAVEKIKHGKTYDVIFMDHMMPGMDGIEATKKLRDFGYTKPIIILTANAPAGSEDDYLTQGFDGFLSKPIITESLHAILIKHVQRLMPS